MNKKVIIAVIAVIVLGVGGYLIFHKSPAKTTSSTTTSTNSTSSTAPASSGAIIQTKTTSGIGEYLADGSGNTLYTYDGDNPGTSNCTGSCLSAWPAYTAKSSTASLPANVSTIKRSDDDTTQYTYKNMPLYYFASDSAGKVTGDGVSGFHVAKP
ncbi:MAG TPA: hypothetical protein VLF90_01665 [Patescibacteria group bacterium]|nr:hypothetical protein [Patescibacteria group bacterium]